jgi:hypothetical protein
MTWVISAPKANANDRVEPDLFVFIALLMDVCMDG